MYRKISNYIEKYLTDDSTRILCIDGARQVGKTYIIRETAKRLFPNYIELNMANDKVGSKAFQNVNSTDSFYLQLGSLFGDRMKERKNTIVFIDEIQEYPHLFTLLKPLREENRFKYICSGSNLGIALKKSTMIPMGSITEKKIYPMDFEEFIIANGVGSQVINHMRDSFKAKKSLDESLHERMLDLFRMYLLIGGLPAAISKYIETKKHL